MAESEIHVDKYLFDYLNGSVDAQRQRNIDEHLDACADCAQLVGLVRALKSARYSGQRLKGPHPDVSELADFFYGKLPRHGSETAAHVAACASCCEEIAQYARAEAAASQSKPAEYASSKVPTAAWDMIHEWEDSSFAKPRAASEVMGQDLLSKLAKLLDERRDWVLGARQPPKGPASVTEKPGAVPVIVVDRSGELRSVEMFEIVTDERGIDVLRHSARSERFNDRQVHALLNAEGRQHVISYRIGHDSIRLAEAGRFEGHVDYFMIED